MTIFDGVKFYLGGLIGKMLVFVSIIVVLVLLLVLTGCGRDPMDIPSTDPSAYCESTAFVNVGNATFFVNDKGTFVPAGWVSSETPDSCNQVMKGTLTNSDTEVAVVNGIPQSL